MHAVYVSEKVQTKIAHTRIFEHAAYQITIRGPNGLKL
jgi:hypothetical protein